MRPPTRTDLPLGWPQIRDESFQVVLLTQRADGFWALPATRAEMANTYAPLLTREHAHRSHDDFGHPSITMSVNALLALEACAGTLPDGVAAAALEAIETHRGPQGAYGTPVPRLDQVEINAVPRHTAMAAVAHLLFSPAGRPEALAKHLEPTVEWLLESRLRNGGWPYDRSVARAGLGFMSTASAICALALYLELPTVSKGLASSLRSAADKGLQALAAAAQRGLWEGDGSPPLAQISDSAFALRVLLIASWRGRLLECGPAATAALDRLVEDFLGHRIASGWPQREGEDRADPTSTIAALLVDRMAPAQIGRGATLGEAEATILNAYRDGGLREQLAAWDWQCLARLAADRAGPVAGAERKLRLESAAAIRSRWSQGRLRARDLAILHSPAREAAMFALTAGAGFEPVTKRLRREGATIAREMAHSVVAWLIFGVAGFVLSWLLFGTTLAEYVRRALDQLA